jgi:hypothetical protein
MNKPYGEYRGCEHLVYAEIIADTAEKFETGPVKDLAGLATVGFSTEQASETKFYDNAAAFTVVGEGVETRTFGIDHLDLATLGEITGQYVDSNGALITGSDKGETKYFAVGYMTEVTTGVKTYKWALKGTFSIPEETNNTKNNGTDSNGTEITYTGIKTIHQFKNGGRAVSVNLEDTGRDMSTWFETVQTPDTLSTFAKTGA